MAQVKPSPVETVFAPAEVDAISDSNTAKANTAAILEHETARFERESTRICGPTVRERLAKGPNMRARSD
jgi:hypothetical protein